MTSRPDYPAAHSMDTFWFAVDRDGHVAMFSSGEAGAVPVDALMDEGALGQLDGPTASTGSAPVYVREGRLERPGPRHRSVLPGARSLGCTLVFLDDPAVASREVAAGRAREARVTAGAAVVYPDMSPGDHERLHAAGECAGCFFETGATPAAALGFFQYEHRTENWVAGPYDLEAKPTAPISEDSLPGELRGSLVRFEGRFDETPSLQPVESWRCEAWGAAYLSGDGRSIRAIPGKEKEYAREFADLAGSAEDLRAVPGLEGIEVQPPDPAGRSDARRPWWRFW